MRISDWSSTCALPICLKFPTTKVFSELARKSLPEVDPRDCPDAALLAWMEREELLFRRLERHIVAERISSGFLAAGGADVDGFLGFSLSVQRSEEHTSELQSLMRISYAVFCLKKKNNTPYYSDM